jgi:hypothetical protein
LEYASPYTFHGVLLTRRWFGTFSALTFVCLSLASQASSEKLLFGAEERVSYVAPVALKGPSGEPLFLGRKITTNAFFLPYTMSKAG